MTTPDAILGILARGPASGPQLQRALRVSQPTLSRAITQLGESIVRLGRARSTRYALPRELPPIGSSWPVFVIDAAGRPAVLGRLHALAGDRYGFQAASGGRDELSGRLPFFLQDLCPQGFLGRTVPGRFPELALPQRLADWSDTHHLIYLSRRGEDCAGNVIVGDESLHRYLGRRGAPLVPVDERDRAEAYGALAASAIAGAPAGSLVGGDHPKFTAAVQTGGVLRHVLVKFSPGGDIDDRAAARWADLLVCEHLASLMLARAGIPVPATTLITSRDRTFLESERFDRTGLHGRIGTVSLAALADHFLGRRGGWVSAARGLAAAGRISGADYQVVRRVVLFGRLIGNTDVHCGNVTFFPSSGGAFALAPVYDMSPTLYAPVGGAEPAEPELEPALPTADDLDIWRGMADLAVQYWRRVAAQERISRELCERAARNARQLAETAAACCLDEALRGDARDALASGEP